MANADRILVPDYDYGVGHEVLFIVICALAVLGVIKLIEMALNTVLI